MNTYKILIYTYVLIFLLYSSSFFFAGDPQISAHLFIFFPIIFFISKNRNLNKTLYFIIFFYFLYTSFNWYFLSYPYFGNRAFTKTWISLISFFLGALVFSDKDNFQIFKKALIIIAIFSSFYATFEFLEIIAPKGLYQKEVSGHIGHKNIYSLVILIAFFLHLFNVLENIHTFKNHPLNLIALIALIIGIIVSNSRGAQGLLIIGIFIISILYKNKLPLRKISNHFFIISFSFLVLLLLLILFIDQAYLIRIVSLFIDTGNIDNVRSILFKTQITLFEKHKIFGIGLGNFPSFYTPLTPTITKQNIIAFRIPSNGHNDYLETLCETGIIGFIVTYSIWIYSLTLGFKKIIIKKNKQFYLPIIFIVILIMLHASFSVATRRTPTLQILWIFIGILSSEKTIIKHYKTGIQYKNLFVLILIIINIFFIFLWGQSQYGDYKYLQIKDKQLAGEKIKIEEMKNILIICPYQMNILYQISYLSLKNGYYDYSLSVADYIDKIGPNLRPTDMIRARCAFLTEDYVKAEYYVKKTLKMWPNAFESNVLLGNIYKHTHQCERLESLKKMLIPKSFNPEIKIIKTSSSNKYLYNHTLKRHQSLKDINEMECNEKYNTND